MKKLKVFDLKTLTEDQQLEFGNAFYSAWDLGEKYKDLEAVTPWGCPWTYLKDKSVEMSACSIEDLAKRYYYSVEDEIAEEIDAGLKTVC